MGSGPGGGVWSRGVSGPGGSGPEGVWSRGVSAPGGGVSQHALRQTPSPPPRGQNS